MGTSHSWGELESKLLRLANDYADLPKVTVAEAALVVKKAVLSIAPARLSGVGKKGAKLDVRYTLAGAAGDAKALVYAQGPWQLIEAGTRPHQIPRERGPRAKRRYAVVDGHPYSRVHHPGTKGQHPWAKGVVASRPVVRHLFEAKATILLTRIF